ncbi:MAG: hypothetical protein AAGH42_03495 [Pseudomonadota bacterium]
MRFLNSTLHGYIDYAAALALIIAPFFFLPASAPAIATWLSVAAGSALIVYSLITDYSASVRRAIPFPVHLAIDLTAGLAFVLAPLALGFEGLTQLYYQVMGGAIILVVLVSSPRTTREEKLPGHPVEVA